MSTTDPLDSGLSTAQSRGRRVVFASEPSFADLKQARSSGAFIVYQCSRCNRNHRMDGVQIVLLQGKYFCLEHYRDARLELAYAEPGYPDEWQERELAKVMAAHPEWQRQADETRTQYTDRMIAICKQKTKTLMERVSPGK